MRTVTTIAAATLAAAAHAAQPEAGDGLATPPPRNPDIQQDRGRPARDPRLPEDFPEVRGREDFLAHSNDDQELFMRFNRPSLSFFSGAGVAFAADAGFNDGDGSVARARVNGEFGPAFRVTPKTTFAIRFTGEYSAYEFDDATGLAPGTDDPFSDIVIGAVAPVVNFNGDDWDFFFGAQVETAGEPGAVFDETLRFGGFGGFTYRFSDTLTLGLGVSFTTDFEDPPFGFPFPLIDWEFADRLSLRTDQNVRGVALAYEVNEDIDVALFGGFERRQFRLDDEGPIPSGIVTDSAAPIGLGVVYQPNRQFILSAAIGAHVWGELDIDDKDGDDLTERQIDPTLFAGLQLSLRF